MLFRGTSLLLSSPLKGKARDLYTFGLLSADGLGRIENSARFDDKWEMYFTGNHTLGELALHKRSDITIEIPKDASPTAALKSASNLVKDFNISPWHGLISKPPDANSSTFSNLYTYVNEIPVGTREKIEMKPKIAYNPLRQDRFKKDNTLRSFMYGKMPFNYGFIPRTLEDPTVCDPHLKMDGVLGDGDPIDVIELSTHKPINTGEVAVVRVLGALALLDEGECDWKLITAAVGRDDVNTYKHLRDVPQSRINQIIDWFRMYKTADGKKQNEFGFDTKVLDEAFAMEVIEATRAQYDALRAGKSKATDYWVPEMEEWE